MNPYLEESVKLRARIEYLESEIAFLQPNSDAYDEVYLGVLTRYPVTSQQAKFVAALMKGGVVRRDVLRTAIATDLMEDYDSKLLDVVCCNTRKRLPWLKIHTVWGIGYRLSDEMIQHLKDGTTP